MLVEVGRPISRKTKTFKCTDAGVLIKRTHDWRFDFKFKKDTYPESHSTKTFIGEQ